MSVRLQLLGFLLLFVLAQSSVSNAQGCRKRDFVFILDKSQNVSMDMFRYQIKFFSQFVSGLSSCFDSGKMRASIIVYGVQPVLMILKLKQPQNASVVINALNSSCRSPVNRTGRNTLKALSLAIKKVKRNGRKKADLTILLIASGLPSNNMNGQLNKVIKRMNRAGIVRNVIAVGSAAQRQPDLERLAGNRNRLLAVPQFRDLTLWAGRAAQFLRTNP